MIIRIVLISFAVLLSTSSQASEEEHHIALQAFSYHFKKSEERQAVHPALGYEYSPYRSMGWQVGFFKDSFGYRSGYAGLNYPVARAKVLGIPLRLIGAVNVMHKQYVKGGEGETRLVPFPIVEAKLRKNVSLNFTGSPQLDYAENKRTNGVVVMQLKLRWNN